VAAVLLIRVVKEKLFRILLSGNTFFRGPAKFAKEANKTVGGTVIAHMNESDKNYR
jgi:hypothetical protein